VVDNKIVELFLSDAFPSNAQLAAAIGRPSLSSSLLYSSIRHHEHCSATAAPRWRFVCTSQVRQSMRSLAHPSSCTRYDAVDARLGVELQVVTAAAAPLVALAFNSRDALVSSRTVSVGVSGCFIE
jgi:hypothetical protein